MKNMQKSWIKTLLLTLFGLTTFLAISTVTFAVAPVMQTTKYQDVNGDGRVDTILITYDASLTTCGTVALTDYSAYVANDITGSLLTGGSLICNDTTETVTITLGTIGNANITSHATAPTITYTGAAGKLTDGSANAITLTNQAIADGAGPVVTALNVQDTSNNGILDTIALTYSESLADTASGANGFVISSAANHGACAAAVADPAASASLTVASACTNVLTSVGDLIATFTANAGIKDAANNNSPTKTFTVTAGGGGQPAITDNAKPILTAVAAGTSAGANTIAFTYSEVITATNGASTTSKGDLTTEGQFIGLGTLPQETSKSLPEKYHIG